MAFRWSIAVLVMAWMGAGVEAEGIPVDILPPLPGIPAAILPNITTLTQPNNDFINSFINSFTGLLPPDILKVVTCGGWTVFGPMLSFQNPKWPNEELDLPSLCILNYQPPPNTAAIRVSFDDLDLPSNDPFNLNTPYCTQYQPFFKMSTVDGSSNTFCTDVTGYEGILGVDPVNGGSHVLMLQLDPTIPFRFRINITAVNADNVQQFTSPRSCGIKNQMTQSGRSEMIPEQRQPVDDAEDEELEEEEQLGLDRDARNARGRKGGKQQARKKAAIIERLKMQPDLISHVQAAALKNGKIKIGGEKSRIIGAPADILEWPWMVAIERPNTHTLPFAGPSDMIPCSGVLLDESRVLTSFNCISFDTQNTVKANALRVWVGDHNITTPNEVESFSRGVSKVIVPLYYSKAFLRDQSVILELDQPVQFNTNIRPICLPVDYNVFPDDEGWIAGWGTDIFGNEVTSLLEFPVTIQQQTECPILQTFLDFYTLLTGYNPANAELEKNVCAGATLVFPVCDGDSGVPLMKKDQTGAYFLYAIQTVRQECQFITPSVFTKVNSKTTFMNVALG